jgi:hypothetical protein
MGEIEEEYEAGGDWFLRAKLGGADGEHVHTGPCMREAHIWPIPFVHMYISCGSNGTAPCSTFSRTD